MCIWHNIIMMIIDRFLILELRYAFSWSAPECLTASIDSLELIVSTLCFIKLFCYNKFMPLYILSLRLYTIQSIFITYVHERWRSLPVDLSYTVKVVSACTVYTQCMHIILYDMQCMHTHDEHVDNITGHTYIGTAIFSWRWLVWGSLRLTPCSYSAGDLSPCVV